MRWQFASVLLDTDPISTLAPRWNALPSGRGIPPESHQVERLSRESNQVD